MVTIFTKSDKLKQNELAQIRKDYPDSVFVSTLKNRGINKSLELVFDVLFGQESKND